MDERDGPALTPGGVLLRRPSLLAAVALAFAALALAAGMDSGPLVDLDGDLAGLAADARSPVGDGALRAATELGGGWVVIPVTVVCAAVVVRRAPAIALLMVVVVAVRYGLEDALKEWIGRQRPVSGRLVEASGRSFPSGHALGATVGWGLPPAAALVATGSRTWWRRAMGLWAVVTAVVAVSRAYLGVHWVTDTVGSILLGLLLLALVDAGASAARTGRRG